MLLPGAPPLDERAFQILGAGPGEDVIIAYGHAARVALEPALAAGEAPKTPVDAAVVAIVMIVTLLAVALTAIGFAYRKRGK